jgi:hypothetical protein
MTKPPDPLSVGGTWHSTFFSFIARFHQKYLLSNNIFNVKLLSCLAKPPHLPVDIIEQLLGF